MNVYLAPFHSSFEGYDTDGCHSSFKPLTDALDGNGWPYDTGDDPSFFSARHCGGQVTWGICRQQVRNRIEPGDVVVLFSFRKEKLRESFEYRLCAIVTVQRKVRQSDIWVDPALRVFRRYLNLLIRPAKRMGWEHFEPGLPTKKWHDDWVWRLAEHDGFRKRDFATLNGADVLPVLAKVRGHLIQPAENYIIFSEDPRETYIFTKPPLVARCKEPGRTEEWQLDTLSQKIKKLTVDYSKQRGHRGTLRTTNRQRPHPVARWRAPSAEVWQWRECLIAVCQDYESTSERGL